MVQTKANKDDDLVPLSGLAAAVDRAKAAQDHGDDLSKEEDQPRVAARTIPPVLPRITGTDSVEDGVPAPDVKQQRTSVRTLLHT